MNLREIAINEIKYNFKKRIRNDLGDLNALKDSIQKHGLFYPVIVNEKLELLAGQRRLESVKELGWTMIPALIVKTGSELEKFEIEIEENMARKEFTLEEVEILLKRKRELLKSGFWHKLSLLIKRFVQWLKDLFS